MAVKRSARKIARYNLDCLLKLIEKKKVSRRLDYIYQQIPETACERSGKCCFNCAEVYRIEFLNIYQYLETLPASVQDNLLKKVAYYELLNLVSLDYRCPFLNESQCLIYPKRPLQCHFFDLYPENEYQTMKTQSRRANEELAKSYAQKFGLILPREVISYDVDQCHHNVDGQGRILILTAPEREHLENHILALEAETFGTNISLAAQHKASFSYHFMLNYFADGELLKLKVKVMKEWRKGPGTEIVDKIIEEQGIKFS